MKNFFKGLNSWLFLLFTIACVYGTFFYHDPTYSPMAKNLLIFIAWAAFLANFVSLFGVKTSKSFYIPQWVRVPVELIIVAILVAHGWFGIGTLWLMATIFKAVAEKREDEKKENV